MAACARASRSPGSGTETNVRLSSHGNVLVPVTTSYTGIAHGADAVADVLAAGVATSGVTAPCFPAWSFWAGAAAPEAAVPCVWFVSRKPRPRTATSTKAAATPISQ